jgi:ligand-binding SRPBCC domain-containing protein
MRIEAHIPTMPSNTLGFMAMTVVERRSVVGAPAESVWQRMVTPEGINDEMRPWMTMSMPRGAGPLTVDTMPVGTPVGRAWLRLFGVLPFDYDHLVIVELEPGRRFLEESTMLSMSRWRHERTVTADGDTKSVVHDRITFQPRLPLRPATPVLAAVVRALFGHRHRRLQRHFDRRT